MFEIQTSNKKNFHSIRYYNIKIDKPIYYKQVIIMKSRKNSLCRRGKRRKGKLYYKMSWSKTFGIQIGSKNKKSAAEFDYYKQVLTIF